MAAILHSIFDGIAPRRCVVCGAALTQGEQVMCLKCDLDAPRTMLHRDPDFNEIHKRLGRTAIPINKAMSWLYYYSSSPYADIVRRSKYSDRPALARNAARLYAAELQASGVLADIDVLLPVPMHWLKRMRRGYNQAEEVARGLGAVAGIPVGDNLVARRGHSTQTHLSQHDRAANLSGRFSVVAPDELAGLNVMVVDDIITTGATMIEAARALASTAVASLSLLSLGLAHLR